MKETRLVYKMSGRGVNAQTSSHWMDFIALSFWTLVLMLSTLPTVEGCGGFYDIGSGRHTFFSPNFPGSYPEAAYCVWIVTAQTQYRIQLTFSFQGDRYNGTCADYVEVRDGGPSGSMLGTYCDNQADTQVMTSNIWLTVKLKSDQLPPQSGTHVLNATATAVYNSTSVPYATNQVPDCRTYQFECSNRVCISMSYRCDNYNDCGCLDGCDEDGCGSLTIGIEAQVGISVAVGFVLFVFICFIANLFDSKNVWMGNRTEAILEKEMERQVQRRRASRMYTKFLGPFSKSNTLIFDKSDNKKCSTIHNVGSPRFDSTLKITDCEA